MQVLFTTLYGLGVIVLLIFILRQFLDYEREGIAFMLVVALFIFKCLMGWTNFLYVELSLGKGDALGYARQALELCRSLYLDPAFFRTEFFMQDYVLPDEINPMSRDTTFWQGLGIGIHRMILTIFMMMSFGSTYILTIWFGILSFLGQWYIFKSFSRIYPQQRVALFLFINLLPLTAFWSPGLSKESYMLLSIGGILYNSLRIKSNDYSARHILGLMLGFVLLFLVRNFYIFSLLPCLIFWLLTPERFRYNFWFYLGLGLISCSAFLLSSYLPEDSAFNFYHHVADRQSEFLALGKRGSYLEIPQLLPHGANFFQVLSISFNHVFLRPWISDIYKPDQVLYLLSNLMSWILVLSSLRGIQKSDMQRSFFWFILSFTVANMLFIGLSVTAYGAICRYKMVFDLLFLTTFFGIFSRKYLSSFIKNQ